MPYIPAEDRGPLAPTSTCPADYPGDLNYQISMLVDEYLGKSPDYQAFNDVIGVLQCAKLEIYRRLVAPYEDRKRLLNGDVYIKKVNQ